MAQRGPHPLLIFGGLAVVLALAGGAWFVLQDDESLHGQIPTKVVKPTPPAKAGPKELDIAPLSSTGIDVEPVPPPEPPARGRIEGRLVREDRRVVKAGTIEALAGETLPMLGGARLQRLGLKTTIEADGRFAIDDVPPGIGLTLRADGDDFAATDKGPFTVLGNETLEVGDFVVDDGLTIRGYVYDETGRGVAGAQVALGTGRVITSTTRPARVVLTDEEGRYSMPQIPIGPFALVASAEGYGNASARGGTLADDGTTVTEIVLHLRKAAVLTGELVSHEGLGLKGAEVVAVPRGPDLGGGIALTDSAGRFRFDDLEPGDYELKTDPMDYLPAQAAVSAGDFDGGSVQIVARAAGMLAGRVVAPNGDPVRAYDMLVRFGTSRAGLGSTKGRSRRVTDPEGRFQLTDLGPGWYRFEIWARGFGLTASQGVRVRPGEQIGGVEITLQLAARVGGRVVTDDGRPVAGAQVRLLGNKTAEVEFLRSMVKKEAWHAVGQTDEEGLFELTDVSPRAYQIEVDHPDFPIRRRNDIEAVENELTTVDDFVLVRSASLRGFATDSTGQPVPRVLVLLKGPPGVASRQTRSNGDGAFQFTRLPPGTYVLRTSTEKAGFDSLFTSLAHLKDPSLQAKIDLSPGEEGVLNVAYGN